MKHGYLMGVAAAALLLCPFSCLSASAQVQRTKCIDTVASAPGRHALPRVQKTRRAWREFELYVGWRINVATHLSASLRIPEETVRSGSGWSSSAPHIASIDASGNVTALAAGVTTLTAAVGG